MSPTALTAQEARTEPSELMTALSLLELGISTCREHHDNSRMLVQAFCFPTLPQTPQNTPSEFADTPPPPFYPRSPHGPAAFSTTGASLGAEETCSTKRNSAGPVALP